MATRKEQREIGRQRAAEMAALRESGKSLRDLAAIYGYSFQRVHQILQRYGFDTTSKVKLVKFTELDLDAFYELYQGGLTLNEIAQEKGISASYLRTLFEQRGYRLRRRGAISNWSSEKVMQLNLDYQSGMSQIELAQKYGVGQSRISYIMRRYGLDTRGFPEAVRLGKHKKAANNVR